MTIWIVSEYNIFMPRLRGMPVLVTANKQRALELAASKPFLVADKYQVEDTP